jgi:hypothetical protein
MRYFLAVLLALVFVHPTLAEGPVYFADAALEDVVESELGFEDPTPSDMLGLTYLNASERDISDLTGLEYAENLRSFACAHSRISDLSPLSGLSNLEDLALNTNEISDLSPLSGLSNLRSLNIHDNEISDLSPLGGLVNLSFLDLHANQISDLSALSGMSSLDTLILEGNEISDVSPLGGLGSLRTLRLGANTVSDLSPLSGLSDLDTLSIYANAISDLSPLSAMSGLQSLSLSGNEISDVSALTSLHCLRYLDIANNPLSVDACTTYIPEILANNPGMSIRYDPCVSRRLSISAGIGGWIVSPGEGQFGYEEGATARIEAQAKSGFAFAGFSGTYNSPQNPIYVTMDRDHAIRADFVCTLETIHVDDDGPGDWDPCNPRISDPWENGTVLHPFDSIQEAIGVAADGARIFVHAGTYRETVDLLGKDIELTGLDRAFPYETAWPVIDGAGNGPVVSLTHGEGPNCRLTGLVICGAKARAAAILCSASSPTISNCFIVGNRTTEPNGAAICCTDSQAAFVNCTIADNQMGTVGAALYLRDSPVSIVNSILWGNVPAQIMVAGADQPVVSYSTVASGWPGTGNLALDPLFAAAGRWVDRIDVDRTLKPDDPRAAWFAGDYHLRSQTGRWNPEIGEWLKDKLTSPGIDGGDPTTPVGREPAPNGAIINLGAYGGTAEASKSSAPAALP